MKKNNEEAPEYKNNPPKNYIWKQMHKRQMHMDKVGTKMRSAQQINCYMGLKHSSDSDTHLRRHRRHLPWFQRGIGAQSHTGWPGCCSIPHRSPWGEASAEAKGEYTPWVGHCLHSLSGRGRQDQPWGSCPSHPIPQESVAEGDESSWAQWSLAKQSGSEAGTKPNLSRCQCRKWPWGTKWQQNQDKSSSAQTKPQRQGLVKSHSATWNRAPAELSRNRWNGIMWPGFQGVVHHCSPLSRS